MALQIISASAGRGRPIGKNSTSARDHGPNIAPNPAAPKAPP